MNLSLLSSHDGTSLLVTSLKSVAGSILSLMGMDQVLIDFLFHTAIGAGSVLLVLGFVGIGMPRRAVVATRRVR